MSRRLELGLLAILALDPDLARHTFELIQPLHFSDDDTRHVYVHMQILDRAGMDLDFLNLMAGTEADSGPRQVMLELGQILQGVELDPDDGNSELLDSWAKEIWGGELC